MYLLKYLYLQLKHYNIITMLCNKIKFDTLLPFKLADKSFCRAAFSYSTTPWTFNFPWSLAYIRNLAFGSPWGNYSLPVLCAANIRRPGIPSVHIHCPLRLPIHTFGRVEPEKFTLGQSGVRTTDLSICRRTHYQWTWNIRMPIKSALVRI